MSSGHTVASFDAELSALHRTVAEMGDGAADLLADAVNALASNDPKLAASVIERDAEVDRREREVEAVTVRLLALRQPVARDLREVIAALKISANLERIGDFAANVAKRVIALNSLATPGPPQSMAWMGRTATAMVRDVIAAYVGEDVEPALAVRNRDSEVDAAYTGLFRELLTYMMEAPQQITACTHLLFIAKNFERIGDHATNVAEQVCFLVSGRLPESERAKEDLSSFTVLDVPSGMPGP